MRKGVLVRLRPGSQHDELRVAREAAHQEVDHVPRDLHPLLRVEARDHRDQRNVPVRRQPQALLQARACSPRRC